MVAVRWVCRFPKCVYIQFFSHVCFRFRFVEYFSFCSAPSLLVVPSSNVPWGNDKCYSILSPLSLSPYSVFLVLLTRSIERRKIKETEHTYTKREREREGEISAYTRFILSICTEYGYIGSLALLFSRFPFLYAYTHFSCVFIENWYVDYVVWRLYAR